MRSELTVPDKQRLAECEKVVDTHKDSWFKAGMALAEIRDSRLYRGSHKTFTEYLKDRWDMGKSHAYRLIDASEVVQTISPIGEINEHTARQLAKVEPAARQAVLEAAQESGESVAGVLDRVFPKANGSLKQKKPKDERKAGRPKKEKITVDDVRKQTAAKRAGKEYTVPGLRKQANDLFGRLVRMLDKMGLSKSVDAELKTILKAIKGAK